jgi:hypothetical protein
VKSNYSWFFSALLATAWLAAPVFADEARKPGRVPLPKVNITKTDEKCVEPTDVMRRSHMDFILHQRDETMHRGIRTSKHSLKNCVNCHADPASGSVLGKDGFCSSCHHYAAVHIDCFGCHSPKPEAAAKKAEVWPAVPSAKQAVKGAQR